MTIRNLDRPIIILRLRRMHIHSRNAQNSVLCEGTQRHAGFVVGVAAAVGCCCGCCCCCCWMRRLECRSKSFENRKTHYWLGLVCDKNLSKIRFCQAKWKKTWHILFALIFSHCRRFKWLLRSRENKSHRTFIFHTPEFWLNWISIEFNSKFFVCAQL